MEGAECHGLSADARIPRVVKDQGNIHLCRAEGRLTAAGAFDLSPRPNHLKILETGHMSISMYRLTVPMFQRGLASLKTYLDKAEAYAKEKNIDPAILIAARLAPDMLPLSGQYQRASDTAKFALARLTATDAPKFDDNETTFDDLRERLAKTEAYLGAFSAQALEGTQTRQITLPGKSGIIMPGGEYIATFALPNFYFHVTTAHAILRNQGAPIGKRDYLG